MNPLNFQSILDNCIERIRSGENLNRCLADYPDHAADLLPLLSLSAELIELEPLEMAPAGSQKGRDAMFAAFDEVEQNRAAAVGWMALLNEKFDQFFGQLIAPTPKFSLVGRLALILVGVGVSSGLVVNVSADSLPGDQLYPVKRFVEDARLTLTFDENSRISYQAELEARRRQEVQELQAAGRPAEVEFSGQIEAITEDYWLIDGIEVQPIPELAVEKNVEVGQTVNVDTQVDEDGTIIVRGVEIDPEPIAPEPVVPVATETPIPTATETDVPPTSTPAATNTVEPSPTPSPTPTVRPTETAVRETATVPSLGESATRPAEVTATAIPTKDERGEPTPTTPVLDVTRTETETPTATATLHRDEESPTPPALATNTPTVEASSPTPEPTEPVRPEATPTKVRDDGAAATATQQAIEHLATKAAAATATRQAHEEEKAATATQEAIEKRATIEAAQTATAEARPTQTPIPTNTPIPEPTATPKPAETPIPVIGDKIVFGRVMFKQSADVEPVPVFKARIIAKHFDTDEIITKITGERGGYEMKLGPGKWIITVEPTDLSEPAGWAYAGERKSVIFEANEANVEKEVNFLVIPN